MPALNWLGEEAVRVAARRTPIRALEPLQENDGSLPDPADGNVLIQGDNLAGMKALFPYYTNAFKLIYMDPPYNTGSSTWMYNDAVDSPQIKAWLHKEVGPEDLARSDKWLCMILPRVELALSLLRAGDGVLVVSIDDAEVAHLRVLLDSLLGRANHIATICWKTRPANNQAKHVGVIHEYLVVYAQNYTALKELDPRWRINKPGVDEVLAWEEELMADASLTDDQRSERIRGRHLKRQQEIAEEILLEEPDLPASEGSKRVKKRWDALRRYNRFDAKGLYRPDNLSWPKGGGPRYEVLHPKTRKPVAIPKGGWMWIETTMRDRIADGRVLFGPDHATVPQQKIYLQDTETVVLNSVSEIPGKNGTDSLEALVPEANFPYPKPVELLQQIIELTTRPGDLIMDPFVGSGTTAEAVLRLNAVESHEPARRFVCIEMEKAIEESVTSVRIDRLIAGYDNDGKRAGGVGGSYSRWTLGDPFRLPDGGLGSTSRRALASVLAAHHCGPDYQLVDDGSLVARGDGIQLHLFDAGDALDAHELASLAHSLGTDTAVVYADRILIDESEAAEHGIVVLQMPYDMPVPPV